MSLEIKDRVAALRARLASLPAKEAQALAAEFLGDAPYHDLAIRDANARAQLEGLPVEARRKLANEFLDGPPGRLDDFLRAKDLRGMAAQDKSGLNDADLAKHVAAARAQYETLSAGLRDMTERAGGLAGFASTYLSSLGFEVSEERIEKALNR